MTGPPRVSPPPDYPGTPMLSNIILNFDQPNDARCSLRVPIVNTSRPRVSSPEVIILPGMNVNAGLDDHPSVAERPSDSVFVS